MTHSTAHVAPIPQSHNSLTKLPSQQAWRQFLDKTLLSIGAVAIVLALVFFIAYNWNYMGKTGKLALVEAALVISVFTYVLVTYWQKYLLGSQLLLLIASIITGSLLALVGQIYQTGADTWQLFTVWAVLIIPFVFIARFPALWLMWLGLINISTWLFININGVWLESHTDNIMMKLIIFSVLNFVAFCLWLYFIENKSGQKLNNNDHHPCPLHWSTYIVGLVNLYFVTLLGIFNTNYFVDGFSSAITLILAALMLLFFYVCFYKKRTDMLILTALCVSAITIVMWMTIEHMDIFSRYDEAGALFTLSVMLIGMCAAAIVWLKRTYNRIHSAQALSSEHATPNDELPQSEQHENGETVAQTHASTFDDDHTPWYIQVFLVVSGVASGALVLAFFLVLSLNMEFEAFGWIGGVLLVVAFVLFKSKQHVFLNGLAFSLSFAGQIFMLIAILDNAYSPLIITYIILAMQLILLTLMPNFIYRTFSAFAALGCMVWLLSYYNVPEVSAGLLALITCLFHLKRHELLARFGLQAKSANPHAAQGIAQIMQALAYASVLMLLLISVFFISAEYNHRYIGIGDDFYYHYAVAQGILVVAGLYTADIILRRYQVPLRSQYALMAMGAVVLLGIVSVYVSGLLATSLVFIIGFANQKRSLVALGMAAMVAYIFWYYYQLDTSLLLKSASMLAVGAIVLFIRWGVINHGITQHSIHSEEASA